MILQLIVLACILQGILSSVYLDNNVLHGWKMIPLPFNNLNEIPRVDFFSQIAHSRLNKIIAKRGLEAKFGMGSWNCTRITKQTLHRFISLLILQCSFDFMQEWWIWITYVCFSVLSPGNISGEPTLYSGYFYVDKANLRKDTYLSFGGWTKGIAFINEFNLGRFWPVN